MDPGVVAGICLSIGFTITCCVLICRSCQSKKCTKCYGSGIYVENIPVIHCRNCHGYGAISCSTKCQHCSNGWNYSHTEYDKVKVKVRCGECFATGQIKGIHDEKPKLCHTCNGKGEYAESNEVPRQVNLKCNQCNGQSVKYSTKSCTACNGRQTIGKIPPTQIKSECPKCNGTGEASMLCRFWKRRELDEKKRLIQK